MKVPYLMAHDYLKTHINFLQKIRIMRANTSANLSSSFVVK